MVRPTSQWVVPGPDVVQVALVEPSQTVSRPTVPAPRPEAPKETPRPVEDDGVRLERPRPRPESPRETPTRSPEPAAAATTLPATRVGAAGLQGDLTADAGNFEFTYYLVLIRNRIASNWQPPAGISTGGNRVRAVVYFRVGRSGDLGGVRVETASGVEFFDRSTLRAVTLSDPMPPLPLGYVGKELGIHFGFDWESP